MAFPKTVGDFKNVKICGVDKTVKEIRFWTESDKAPWKCNGVEIILSNFKSVFLGRAKAGDQNRGA